MSSRHRDFLPIALGVFALVTVFAVINDQAIATIAPLHFTRYHPHYFPFDDVRLQALCFALVATGGPGLAWGILLYWAGHYGPGPAVTPRVTLLGAAAVILITALAAWGMGWRESVVGHPPYPDFFYPFDDDKLSFTQTVQLTNYLVGFLGAVAWLFAIFCWRKLQVPEPAEKT